MSRRRLLLPVMILMTMLFSVLKAADGSPTNYDYDSLHRLTRVERSDGSVTVYEYDQLGNRKRMVTTTGGNPTPYTLTVGKSGTGTGTVTSVPAGITCGTDCTEVYSSGTAITLTAVAEAGSTFAGWSGGGCSGTAACTVTMDMTKTVSAIFTDTTPPTTTPSVPSGNYVGTQMITLSVNEGATIFYTLDGTDPTVSGTRIQYTIPISISTTATLKYYAVDTAGNASSVQTQSYTITADPLNTWHWRNPLPQGNAIFGITYANNTFVAVGGDNGGIATSTDGITWVTQPSGANVWAYGITYANGIYVAVGWGGSIYTSPDGMTWTPRTSGTTMFLLGITYANDTFVALGNSGTILTSPDGITWTPRTSGTTGQLWSVAYSNNTFVAVGNPGTILTSPDGITWTPRTSGTTSPLWSVAYANNAFIAVGDSGTILTSPDGVTWTKRTSPNAQSLWGIAYANNAFIAVGDSGTILTSSDGATWTSRTPGTAAYSLRVVAYGNNTFIAGGYMGAVLTSSDGITWPTWTSVTINHLRRVAYANSTCVAVGDSGTILTSSDGATWTKRTSPKTQNLWGIAYANNTFITVGDSGTILTSPDGVTWTSRTPGTAAYGLKGVTYANNTFIAVGDSGTILTSPEGIAWTPRTSGTTSPLWSVAYANNAFITVGDSGTILTSPDGITWTPRTSGATGLLRSVAYANNTFIAVGDSDTILTSPDGVIWTQRTSVGTTYYLSEVRYANNIFVVVGGSGTILTSPDGITWTERTSATNAGLLSSAYADHTFVAVGIFGTILQSDPMNVAQYTLDISKSGTGIGTVTSAPAGINCGTDCSENYSAGIPITLTAVADTGSGSTFTGWSGGGCSGTAACTVTMDAAKIVTAVFTDTTPPTTTPSEPGGNYVGAQIITLSVNEGATVYYTLDGTDPTVSVTRIQYTGPVSISTTTTLKYYAVDTAGNASAVQTQSYTITAANAWTRKADFGGTARGGAVGFSIGNKGYIGTGFDGSNSRNDFWEYDPATNVWTQKANFGGGIRYVAVGFSIGNKGYIGTGFDGSNSRNDFWEYDPATNVWTQKANFGGTARHVATGFSIGNKGYIGTGYINLSPILPTDFWEYDPSTNVWTRKADFGGVPRYHATGFSIGNKGYIGTGLDSTNTKRNDFWEYDPSTNVWTQKANVGGPGRINAVGFSLGSKGYMGTGWNQSSSYKDFWEYDPSTNVWTQKTDFAGTARSVATGFSIGSKGYIGIGSDSDGVNRNDFWEYAPASYALAVSTTGTGSGTITSGPAGILCGIDCSESYAVGTPVVLTASATAGSTFAGWSGSGCSGINTCTITMDAAKTVTAVFTDITPPTITPSEPGGSYVGTQMITLSLNEGATIYYTLDGTDPTTSGTRVQYAGAISIKTTTTLKYYAVDTAGNASSVQTQSYTITAANAWTQKADFGGTARYGAKGFSIESKGYIGTGVDGGYSRDFWEYDPTGNTWTQKADFGGPARYGATGFSIGSKGYIGTGTNFNSNYKDFWEYNPTGNTWTQKADFGGTARQYAAGFSIGSKGYIGTGYDAGYKKDFWEYDPTGNTWTQKADFGGPARMYAVGFSIGSKGYIGTGTGGSDYKGFWEYDPTGNTWAQKADFGGTARYVAVGFSIGTKGYVGTGYDSGYAKDFWEYDSTGNTWTQKSDFGGTARYAAVGFSIASKGYIGTGWDGSANCKDFWEFTPASFALAVSTTGNGSGTVTSAPAGIVCGIDCSESYAIGTPVVLTASPTAGSTFMGWSGGGCSGTAACTVTMDAAKTVTAVFTDSAPPTITPSEPGGSYVGAQVITLSLNEGATIYYTLDGTNPTVSGTRIQYADPISISTTTTLKYYAADTAGNASSVQTQSYTITAANAWTRKADFAGGTARGAAVGFSIGSKGYMGTGSNGTSGTNDFWEYNPSTNVWTQKANFGGGARAGAVGFSIGNKGYIGTGFDGSSSRNDFWEYDPTTNVWTQKANFGGTGRHNATGFSIGNKGYIGTGYINLSPILPTDFWEYDPATNVWTRKADFGGVPRYHASGFSIGNKGYIGTGLDSTNTKRNDFWEYNPSTNVWTQKANFGGTGRINAVGFSLGNKGYIGTGWNQSSFYKDFWEYDPSTNAWIQKADFGGTARCYATGFSIGSKGFVGMGWDGSDRNDFWEYTPASYALAVSTTGTGSGTITSAPAGITCGVDCSESYAIGTSVVLTASPTAGSTFTGWSGAGCSGTAACTVTMDAAKTATAIFTDATPPTITPSEPGGSYVGAQVITLSVNEGATVYYTLDGTDPTTSGTRIQYTGPISISTTAILKYYAVDTAGNVCSVQTQSYTIATPTWTKLPNMHYIRSGATITKLQDGRVLIAGGQTVGGSGNTSYSVGPAEIYDPVAQNFVLTGSLVQKRVLPGSTLLNNGKVLIAGGSGAWIFPELNSVELFEPATGLFSLVGTMSSNRIYRPQAVKLNNGSVLLAGGAYEGGYATATKAVDVYDPATGIIHGNVGSLVSGHLYYSSSALLPDGRVLFVGGLSNYNTQSSPQAEVYNPTTNLSVATVGQPTGTTGTDAKIIPLVTGKYFVNQSAAPNLYDPSSGTFSAITSLGQGYPVSLSDGKVLFASTTGGKLQVFNPSTGTVQGEINWPSGFVGDEGVLLNDGSVLFISTSLGTAYLLNPNDASDNVTTLYSYFTGYGLYTWNGSSWNQIGTSQPASMAVSGSMLYATFSGVNGIYKWDGSAWTKLGDTVPAMIAASGSMLYGYYTGYGLYSFNGTTWTQLGTSQPLSITAAGSMLYATFSGVNGIYKWDGSAWSKLGDTAPAMLAASGSMFYGYYTGYGLYSYNGTTWTQLGTSQPLSITAAGGMLYATFSGVNGIYKWDGSAWSKLGDTAPAMLAASGSMLYAYYTGYGLYSWNGTAWTRIGTSQPAGMAASGN